MSEIVREHFDNFVEAFDTGYQKEGLTYHLARRRQLILEEVHKFNSSIGDGLWLEAGCGAGLLACDLGRLGLKVRGYDFSPQMIERARRNSMELGLSERVTFDVGDLRTLPFDDNSLVGLTCSGVLEYFEDPVPVLKEFNRVLRPGAPYVITFNNSLSPFRWLSGPAKLLRARFQGREVPKIDNHPYSVRRIERILKQNDFLIDSWRRHTFTSILKEGMWLPPLGIARRMEWIAAVPVVRELAWGLIAVGHTYDSSAS